MSLRASTSSLAQLGAAGFATQSNSIRTVTATTTALSTDFAVLGDATTAAIVITLPAAASMANKVMAFKKIDSSANTVTVKGNAAELIDGANTDVLSAQFSVVWVESDGTQWWIL